MRNTVWKRKSLSDSQLAHVRELASRYAVSPILAKLYVERGLLSAAQIDSFTHPNPSYLHDPYLYLDMDKAVDRLVSAIAAGEHILIYGDYDVDGVTSVALVYRYLSQYYDKLGFYVPDRETEGYGVSMRGVDYARDNGYSLIIALDCGIKDCAEVDYAKSSGIDFVICDHHNPDDRLPAAVAVLDAKRADNTYPYRELSGCGVGYKYMQAFAIRQGYAPSSLEPLLDVLALSIASDIVPLTGENRTLIYLGLQRINHSPSIGLATLLRQCELRIGEITIGDIVYKIGPRINASGRIKSADEAVKLLIANNEAEALLHCASINSLNDMRRNYDRQTTEQALAMLSSDPDTDSRCSTVVYDPNWPKGVVGIVASRLTEKYFKPTIVLTNAGEMISGSARSVADFDIYSAIKACADDLLDFGGHDFAAGLSLMPERLADFKLHFEQYVSEHITEIQKMPIIEYDAEIRFADISRSLFADLQLLQPYGQDNPEPVFVTRGVYNVAGSRPVGQHQEHLRLEVSDGTIGGGSKMIGIAFNQSDYYAPLREGRKVDICYTIEENVFRGNSSIQLHIIDIKLSNQI